MGLSSKEKLDIIKGSLSGAVDKPAFLAIQEAEELLAEEEAIKEQSQPAQEQPIEQPEVASTGGTVPASPNVPHPSTGSSQPHLVNSASSMEIGFNQASGTSRGATTLGTEGTYKKGGFNFNKKNNYSIKTVDYSKEAIKKRQENNKSNLSTSEKIDLGLSSMGMIPGVGIVPDAINTVSNFGQGIYHTITGDTDQAKTDYANAGLAATAMIPVFGTGVTAGKNAKTLYRVVNASDMKNATKYASTIPEAGTVGRRTGIMGDVQKNTDFDHLNATTDQSWILGKNNLFDRYDGTHVAKLKYNPLHFKNKNVGTVIDNDNLAKIRPGTGTNMRVSGPDGQNITTIMGPKGTQVADVEEILTKEDYLKLHNKNPKFKWQDGGFNYDPPKIKKSMSMEELLRRQRFQESSFRHGAVNKDSGATGVAQIMPDTLKYAKMKGWVPKSVTMKDLKNFDVSEKIQVNYMNNLIDRDWNKGSETVKRAKALIAYNWGPENTRKRLNKLKKEGIDIYADDLSWIAHFNEESRGYVDRILLNKGDFEEQYTKGLTTNIPLKKRKGGYRDSKMLYNKAKRKK